MFFLSFLFCFMLVTPGYFMEYKYVSISVILVVCFVLENIGKMRVIKIKNNIFYYTFFYVTVGIFYISFGMIKENPGAIYQINAYILYPLFFTFILRWVSVDIIITLVKTTMYSNIIIGTHGILYILSVSGIVPKFFKLNLGESSNIGIYDDHMALALPYLSTLVYTIPFSIFILFLPKIIRREIIGDLPLYIGLVQVIIVSFLSARRAVIVSIFIAPLLIYLLLVIKNSSLMLKLSSKSLINFFKFFLLGMSVIMIIPFIGIFSFDNIMDSIFNVNNEIKGASTVHKIAQSDAMFNQWISSPWMGYGHGSVIKGINSSDETPWAYESTYALLLHNTGLVGFALYASGIMWIYYQGILIFKKNATISSYLMGAMLSGLTCLLIANATNPYIGKFDSIWTIFLPLAIINITGIKNK